MIVSKNTEGSINTDRIVDEEINKMLKYKNSKHIPQSFNNGDILIDLGLDSLDTMEIIIAAENRLKRQKKPVTEDIKTVGSIYDYFHKN